MTLRIALALAVLTACGSRPYATALAGANVCEQLTCDRGMACDPGTGSCTCGGKTCATDQICEAGQCVAAPCQPGCGAGQTCKAGKCVVDPCAGVRCDLNFPGSTCDSRDGFCRCAGERCDLGDLCVDSRQGLTCAARCDPMTATCSGCYLDAHLGAAGCLAPGTAKESAACASANDCSPGLACLPTSKASTCQRVCKPGAHTGCATGETCKPITSAPGLGSCIR